MHQQINLYQPVFNKPLKVFSSPVLLQICATAFLLLLLVASHARWALAGMKTTAQELEYQLRDLNIRLGSLEADFSPSDSKAIDLQVDALRKHIDQRKHLLHRFDQLAQQSHVGFASRFEVLAQLQTPGLWLEGVTISDQQLKISGIALEQKLVPVYLKRLKKHSTFAGMTLETVSMARMKNTQPQIRFVLRNNDGDSAWP